MPLRKWAESAGHAIEGILYAAKTQRHLRYHLYTAAFVLVLIYIFGVTMPCRCLGNRRALVDVSQNARQMAPSPLKRRAR